MSHKVILKNKKISGLFSVLLIFVFCLTACRSTGISNIYDIARIHSPKAWVIEVRVTDIEVDNEKILIHGKANGKKILIRPFYDSLMDEDRSKYSLLQKGKTYLMSLIPPEPYRWFTPPVGYSFIKKDWPGDHPYTAINIEGMYIEPLSEENIKVSCTIDVIDGKKVMGPMIFYK